MSIIRLSNCRFGMRADKLENWKTKNPILEEGEPSCVSDGTETEWLKVGDGKTHWVDLPYKKGPKGDKDDTLPGYINNNFANVLKGEAAGAAIFIDDMSPYTSNIHGNDINPLATVKVYSKNLLDPVKKVFSSKNIFLGVTNYKDYHTLPEGTYTLSVDLVSGGVTNIYVTNADTSENIVVGYGKRSVTFSLDTITNVNFKAYDNNFTSESDIICFQLEIGSTATEVGMYNDPVTYTANEDWTIDIAPIFPYMSILVFYDGIDGSGMSVFYNKDTNRVIEKLTNAIIALGGTI